MTRQYLIPTVGYVNGNSNREFLTPGLAYLHTVEGVKILGFTDLWMDDSPFSPGHGQFKYSNARSSGIFAGVM